MAALKTEAAIGDRCENCKGSGLVLVCEISAEGRHDNCHVEDCNKCEGKGYLTDGK